MSLGSRIWAMNLPRFWRRQPWPQAPEGKLIETVALWEEEETPYYDPKRFYPARLGEILHDRYQLATKLGYGTSSTVWLARDLFRWRWTQERYVAIKINSSDCPEANGAEKELRITKMISKSKSNHIGRKLVRGLLDAFRMQGPTSQHICLVFEPFREPLWIVRTRFQSDVIPSGVLKVVTQEILQGLDFLHRECRIIHADLKPDNILGCLEDNLILEKSARDEFEHPLPQKKHNDRRIYLSRNEFGHTLRIAKVLGRIAITDFGFSVEGDGPHFGPIQAEALRAPEVILDAGWTYSADIWSLGVMLCDLLEKGSMFRTFGDGTKYDDSLHLAYITRLIGPPPEYLLKLGRRTSLFFNSKGNLNSSYDIPSFTFERAIQEISGEEKRMFIKFVQNMLKWDPAERKTAKELLSDPWLYTEFPQDNVED